MPILLAAASFQARASSPVTAPTTSAVLVNGSYLVTATAQLTGTPPGIARGLNLLRVDGAAPVNLGTMHDDGLNGDAVANDGIFSLLFSAPSVAQMQLQTSVPLPGEVRRRKSPIAIVPVVVPKLLSLTPNSGPQGAQNLSVTIAGQQTHFSQDASTATFGPGITVTSLTVNSAVSATAVLDIGAGAALAANDVTVTSGQEVVTLSGAFTVTGPNLPGDVVTWHYDTTRSGLNPNETSLTPANVNSASFGKVAEFSLDGQVDGQVLYLHQVAVPVLGMKNIVYVATENDSVYALDASSISGSAATVLWKTSLLTNGETPATIGPTLQCGDIAFNGVTATPVIDRARNAIYVVTMSQDAARTTVYHRIHALSLTTGAELFGGPTTITATYPGTGGNVLNGVVSFDPTMTMHERAALLESGGNIFTAWSGMYGDCGPYEPWVLTYSADTLSQTGVIDLAPNNSGGGMWMGGAGPAADSAGNVYVITGNGFGGGLSNTGGLPPASYNNSLVKLATAGGLSVDDYFTPYNSVTENNADQDFGSAGPLLLDVADNASTIHHLVMSAGKDGQFYVLDRDSMGEFTAGQNNVRQQFTLSTAQNFSTPVYFNGTVYLGPARNTLRAFAISNALLATSPTMQSSNTFGGSGAVISASSNGNANGIIWALDWATPQNGTLYAYDATNLTTNLYNSHQAAGSRDTFSAVGGHFITPTVVDGKVYFGTGSSLVVFGLLP